MGGCGAAQLADSAVTNPRLVAAFGEDGEAAEGKAEAGAPRLLAIAADFVAAAEKAERDNQRERGLAQVLGKLREVQRAAACWKRSPGRCHSSHLGHSDPSGS